MIVKFKSRCAYLMCVKYKDSTYLGSSKLQDKARKIQFFCFTDLFCHLENLKEIPKKQESSTSRIVFTLSTSLVLFDSRVSFFRFNYILIIQSTLKSLQTSSENIFAISFYFSNNHRGKNRYNKMMTMYSIGRNKTSLTIKKIVA